MKEVTKALCRICEAVKHVQLNLLLYPTEHMKNLVGDLYTHLVKFAIRAVKWYREPRLLHAVTSITRPYALRFRDIVEDIGETIRQIDRLALSMSQVDQRQILLKLDESRRASEEEQRRIRLELEATRRELEVTRKTQATQAETSRLILAEIKMAIGSELPCHFQKADLCTDTHKTGTAQLQFSGLINTNSQLSEIQFSQIMTFLATSNLPSPDLVRHTLSVKRKLRLRLGQNHHHYNPNPPSLYHSPILQTWGASPTSSQILVDGSIPKRHVLQDFAIDVIDLVCGADIPIVWVLQSNQFNHGKTNSTEEPMEDFTATDILKYLAWQILKANHSMVDERSASLSARRFQTARTEKEWFALLGAVLEGLQQVYLVVDLDLVDSLLPPGEEEGQSRWWLGEFSWFFERLRERGVKTVVKVLLFRAATTRGGTESQVPRSMRQRQLIFVSRGGTTTPTRAR